MTTPRRVMPRVEFWVPGKLVNPLNGALSRAHWSVKSRWARENRQNTLLAMIESGVTNRRANANQPSQVTFTAHVAGAWDDDNLPAALKPHRDALVGPLIHSDAPDSGHTFTYRQVIDRTRRGVLVVVETR